MPGSLEITQLPRRTKRLSTGMSLINPVDDYVHSDTQSGRSSNKEGCEHGASGDRMDTHQGRLVPIYACLVQAVQLVYCRRQRPHCWYY